MQIGGQRRDTIEVATDADMFDARHLRRMQNMVDHILELRRRAAESAEPLEVFIPVRRIVRQLLCSALGAFFAGALLRFHYDLGDVVIHECGEKIDHAHAAVFRERAQHVVGHIAGMAAERSTRRMRCYNRNARRLDHSMPRSFIVRTTVRPKSVRPPCRAPSPEESHQLFVLTCVRVM